VINSNIELKICKRKRKFEGLFKSNSYLGARKIKGVSVAVQKL